MMLELVVVLVVFLSLIGTVAASEFQRNRRMIDEIRGLRPMTDEVREIIESRRPRP